MANIPSLMEMLKAGVHFGHRTSRWHPNMEEFIFGERSGVHIIDLEKTRLQLEKAGEFLKNLGMEKGTLFFVGTKRQAREILEKKANECEMPYVIERWVGGTLTNFSTIRKRVQHYIDLKKRQETGELEKYTKKEQHEFSKEIEDLRRKLGGLVRLEKLPDAIFIMDLKTEKTALREALRKNIPVVAVCDTNVNPKGVKYPIPANDDALKSVEMMIEFVAESLKEGKALAPEKENTKQNDEVKKAPKKEDAKEPKKEDAKAPKKEDETSKNDKK